MLCNLAMKEKFRWESIHPFDKLVTGDGANERSLWSEVICRQLKIHR
jgi:hypothetical protein